MIAPVNNCTYLDTAGYVRRDGCRRRFAPFASPFVAVFDAHIAANALLIGRHFSVVVRPAPKVVSSENRSTHRSLFSPTAAAAAVASTVAAV